jgi:serine/threonine-protein kinase HipA
MDDHLRNHGFILKEKGWCLSPAFDINPSVDKSGLPLNIDMNDNALDLSLAMSVGEFFQLGTKDMDLIIDEVRAAVSGWKIKAKKIGISRGDIELMAQAFLV